MSRRELVLIAVAVTLIAGFLGFRIIGPLRVGALVPMADDAISELERQVSRLQGEIDALEPEALWRDARYRNVLPAAEDEVTVRILEYAAVLADKHDVRLAEIAVSHVEEWFGLRLAYVDMRWTGMAHSAGAFMDDLIGGAFDWFVDELAVRRLDDRRVDARLQAQVPFSSAQLDMGGHHRTVPEGDHSEGRNWSPLGPSWSGIFATAQSGSTEKLLPDATFFPRDSSSDPARAPSGLGLSVVGVAFGPRSPAVILNDEQSGETRIVHIGDTIRGRTVTGIVREGVSILDPQVGTEILLLFPGDTR